MKLFLTKSPIIAVFAVLVLALTLSACKKNNEEDLFPPADGSCSTANVSYAKTVLPVLTNHNCVSCHAGDGASGGIRLDSYENLVSAVKSGRFLGAINHESGYSAMPQGGAKLDDCSISQIEAWIEQGSLDN